MTNKEAIELLKRATMFEPTLENRDYPEAFDLAIKALEERPQGEWIFNGFCFSSTQYKCNKCDCPTLEKTNFCPNCGADMKPKPNHLRDCENCVHHSDNGCEVWECEFKRRSS